MAEPKAVDRESDDGSGEGGEIADLMSSLAPLLRHFAGVLQQSGAPAPLQQQLNSEAPQQPTSTDTVEVQAEGEVRPGEDGQGSRESANGESVEAGMESGVTSMVSDDVAAKTSGSKLR